MKCSTYILSLIGMIFFLGVAQAQPAETPENSSYILGQGDVIKVSVLGRDDFDILARVQSDGTIRLPYIGAIRAVDETPISLTTIITDRLKRGGFFSNPIVSIDLETVASRYVTVLGQVAEPGLVSFDRPYRVSEVLARVGGVLDDGADYVVLRKATGEEVRLLLVDVATGDRTSDPYLAAGDKVFVPEAEQFFIYGEVKDPGSYPLPRRATVQKVLARGGGLTTVGNINRIEVVRDGHTFRKVALDFEIEPDDVIIVGERWF